MKRPLQLTFRNMDSSETLEADVKSHVEGLTELCPHIISCHVVITAPAQNHRKGRHFQVRLDVKVPEDELSAGRDHADDVRHEDAHLALADSFRAMKRELTRWNHQRAAHDGATLRGGA